MVKGRNKDTWAEAEQDKDLATIGGRIRYARISKGMTQQEVADALPDIPGRKKSRASIAQYEMGSPPGVDVISDLATILNQNSCYLAFGGEAAGLVPAPQGQRVPITPKGDELNDGDFAFLPQNLLNELGAGRARLELVRLSVDAPSFGVRRLDYLLVDAGIGSLKGDGQIYAVATSVGIALVRSEPLFSQENSDEIHVTTGQGAQYIIPSESVEVAGRLISSLQRPH